MLLNIVSLWPFEDETRSTLKSALKSHWMKRWWLAILLSVLAFNLTQVQVQTWLSFFLHRFIQVTSQETEHGAWMAVLDYCSPLSSHWLLHLIFMTELWLYNLLIDFMRVGTVPALSFFLEWRKQPLMIWSNLIEGIHFSLWHMSACSTCLVINRPRDNLISLSFYHPYKLVLHVSFNVALGNLPESTKLHSLCIIDLQDSVSVDCFDV